MPWTWNADKGRRNKAKHGVSFDTARLVFGDPAHMTRPNHGQAEERWHTIGKPSASSPLVLLVVHTEVGDGGRIISAPGDQT